MPASLGLIVNPVAGIGGRVGLKGSDGIEILARARALGGRSAAQDRTVQALQALALRALPVRMVTAPGSLGQDACAAAGLPFEVLGSAPVCSSARDTHHAVEAFVAAGVDLILFAGGDGTARDVASVAGTIPVLGIPAGVKMYSGVFATSAVAAGRLASDFLAQARDRRRTREVDLLDTDEAALREGAVVRLFGSVRAPLAGSGLQAAKASPRSDDDGQIAALCRDIAARLDPDGLFIVGPGTTTRRFVEACGQPKTLLGVDLLLGRRLLLADAREDQILDHLVAHPAARVVVGLVGGQGSLFGRGNQPISARVLAQVGRDRITVLAGAAKLAGLPRGLFVDTGDAEVDRALSGFIRVDTGPGRSAMVRVRGGDAG